MSAHHQINSHPHEAPWSSIFGLSFIKLSISSEIKKDYKIINNIRHTTATIFSLTAYSHQQLEIIHFGTKVRKFSEYIIILSKTELEKSHQIKIDWLIRLHDIEIFTLLLWFKVVVFRVKNMSFRTRLFSSSGISYAA